MRKLQEINNKAALSASGALSKLIGRQVKMNITMADIRDVGELSPIIAPEEIVAGVYLPVTGEIAGAALLIFPKESAFNLSDLLVRREPGTTRKLTGLDESALKELGNIVCGSYLTVLSNALQVKTIGQVPSFSFDMFGAIVSQIITAFAQKSEKALVVEIEIIFEVKALKGYFLLLLELPQFNAILRSLDSG
jgi:chemotaxis protein CheC